MAIFNDKPYLCEALDSLMLSQAYLGQALDALRVRLDASPDPQDRAVAAQMTEQLKKAGEELRIARVRVVQYQNMR